jgi:hypothetical protein
LTDLSPLPALTLSDPSQEPFRVRFTEPECGVRRRIYRGGKPSGRAIGEAASNGAVEVKESKHLGIYAMVGQSGKSRIKAQPSDNTSLSRFDAFVKIIVILDRIVVWDKD